MKYFETKKGSLEEAISKAINKREENLKEARYEIKFDSGEFGQDDEDDYADMLQGELKGKRIRAKVGPGSKNNTLSFDTNVPKAKMIKIVKDDLGYFVDESVDIQEGMNADTAKAILKMRAKDKFEIFRGDYVPMIYLSNADRDALKDAGHKMTRDIPKPNMGTSVTSILNVANGSSRSTTSAGMYDTNTSDMKGKNPVVINMKKFVRGDFQKIGHPKTVGDLVKMTGLRLNSNDPSKNEATGDKEKYQAFFNKAMKKFGVKSPADFKDDAKKKEFFNYVDKNYKGDHEEGNIKEYVQADGTKRKVKEGDKRLKANKLSEKDLQDNVEESLETIQKVNDSKRQSMRSILADIWKMNEGKSPFEKDEGFASDAQRRAAFASGYKEKGKKGKKEEIENSSKTMTGKKPTKVEVEPSTEK